MSLSIITTIGLKLRMLMFYIEFFCENCIISAVINMQIIFDNVIKKYISKFIQNRLCSDLPRTISLLLFKNQDDSHVTPSMQKNNSCHYYYTPTGREGAILQSPCPSVRSHFRNRYLGFYWKK